MSSSPMGVGVHGRCILLLTILGLGLLMMETAATARDVPAAPNPLHNQAPNNVMRMADASIQHRLPSCQHRSKT
ncbi:hypothetical protein ACP70R_035231 [Stipagrostis hirtigluma subsp. patula]